MIVEIVAIGDELLIGQTINTNASWIGKQLSENGASVLYSSVIRDEKSEILEAVDQGVKRADVTIVTGGLGPTKDDITKYTLCEYFESDLEIHPAILKKIEDYFSARNREILDVNVQQAALPSKAIILENDLGTASGMWFEKDGKVLVSLPGVPYEMKHLIQDRVIPRLKDRFEMKSMYYQTLMTQGIGESYLAEIIADLENEIREKGIGMAYLPSPGAVRVRLSGDDTKEVREKVKAYIEEIERLIPLHAYGKNDESLIDVVSQLLVDQDKTVGTVESCTSGALGMEFTSLSGSSSYFEGGMLTYSNRLKMQMVNVSEDSLEKYGAVSESVVTQMAENGRGILGVDYCIATSGIAGPNGGSKEKPVGTVWIAIASSERTFCKKFLFGDSRERNVKKSVLAAMNMLRCEILKLNK